jgi:hypothetical protein
MLANETYNSHSEVSAERYGEERGRRLVEPARQISREIERREAELHVVIGLDFGTRFSKIAYRVIGVDQVNVIRTDPLDPFSGLFETVMYIDRETRTVRRQRSAGGGRFQESVSFLKVLLKDPARLAELADRDLVDFVNAKTVPALCAFYLAGILRLAVGKIEDAERKRLGGRRVIYSLNISIPAQYCDDEATEPFRGVAATALKWSSEDLGSADGLDIDQLVSRFEGDLQAALASATIGVVPEVVAALYQFLTRRDTPLGVHGFLDIGAGTIDGCVFRLSTDTGSRRINILAARVEPLGSSIIARRIVSDSTRALDEEATEQAIVGASIPATLEASLNGARSDVINFASSILMEARDKMPGHVLVQDPVAAFPDNASRDRTLDKSSFDVHVSGGGANSAWYRTVFSAAYKERNLRENFIMKYGWGLIAPPEDFPPSLPYHRFVIACGLTETIDNLETLIVRLPSQTDPGIVHPPRQSVAIAYGDTKDLT